MLELNQLEQLLAFAQYKTLSQAAAKVLLSQPALTRSMQRLEAELNVPLFDRQKNKIALNEAGQLAVECAEKILYEVQNMYDRLQDYERSLHTISIGSCAPAPLWQLTPKLSACYPAQTITAELKGSQQIRQGLAEGRYDLIITAEPLEDEGPEGFICLPYCREHLQLSVPPAHPLAMYQSITFADLAGETMLLLAEIGFWREVCAAQMPDTEFIVQQEAAAFNSLVRLSALPSFTSDLAQDNYETAHRIIVPITDPAANPTFYCVIPKRQQGRLAAFIDRIKAKEFIP